MKNCRLCRKDIDDSAAVCHHCRSYQKPWRQCSVRYLGPIVSFFVALPAIGILSWQAINYIVHGRSDDVAITLVHVDEEQQRVILAVSNTGGRNAMLRSAEVILPANLAARNAAPAWPLVLPNDRLLPAENQRQLDLISTEGRLPGIADQHQPSITYRIRLVIVRSNDSPKEFYVNYEAREE